MILPPERITWIKKSQQYCSRFSGKYPDLGVAKKACINKEGCTAVAVDLYYGREYHLCYTSPVSSSYQDDNVHEILRDDIPGLFD